MEDGTLPIGVPSQQNHGEAGFEDKLVDLTIAYARAFQRVAIDAGRLFN
jgi:hypothetical protein